MSVSSEVQSTVEAFVAAVEQGKCPAAMAISLGSEPQGPSPLLEDCREQCVVPWSHGFFWQLHRKCIERTNSHEFKRKSLHKCCDFSNTKWAFSQTLIGVLLLIVFNTVENTFLVIAFGFWVSLYPLLPFNTWKSLPVFFRAGITGLHRHTQASLVCNDQTGKAGKQRLVAG